MPKSKRLKPQQRQQRMAQIFNFGKQRAYKLRAWVTLFAGEKELRREALPISKIVENASYLPVYWEPLRPNENVTSLLLRVEDADGGILEDKRFPTAGYVPGESALALTSPIGPMV